MFRRRFRMGVTTILSYLIRRSAILVLSVVIAAVILFVLLRLLPGDPANALVSVGADAAQIEAARKQVGSDLPLYQQFLQFAGNLARFDLGNSFVSGAPVLAEIGKRLMVTVPLTLLAFVVALALAVPLGMLSVVRQNRWYGGLISVVSQLGIAIAIAGFLELPAMALFPWFHRKMRNPGAILKLSGVFVVLKAILTLLAPNVLWIYVAQSLQFFAYALFLPASVY